MRTGARAPPRSGGESTLPSVAAFRSRGPLTAQMMQQLLAGVSTRHDEASLEARPRGRRTRGSSKSAVSRTVVRRTRQRLQEQLARGEVQAKPRELPRAIDRQPAHARMVARSRRRRQHSIASDVPRAAFLCEGAANSRRPARNLARLSRESFIVSVYQAEGACDVPIVRLPYSLCRERRDDRRPLARFFRETS